ncbi:QacE family quaternary ammonium compound efflux SMR transporter [Eggerthellaceae bacterium zg-893]|nr:QacE family quaternary ammonium compound efflux SMR transporter [Eggerthellaceae bacterium zg-893]
MAWVVLIAAGLMEAVWATALGQCEGLSKPLPVIVFVVALALSMTGLGFALRTLPTATAYAVWVGVGAAATVVYAMATGAESASVVKIALLCGLVGCVIGLKLVTSE